ncbi:transketolase family protein [Paramaledivibacter caminithermalis]|jgi:transketolase|uniref:Transketolase n=1 Tax=Paramaledivibacter caminithermalis (strain DSM 15212 / CIP 107654 / DViRD3) TaxID=1121301 RepID=A0A1M6KSV8_PARC5|nr:transketolase family protein [Paramaledivibacter caminithermalis]SHJ62048.1 transketolase [Paramaledivibacter caminithermalis DSM 15212]
MTKKIATRETYGDVLIKLGRNNENIVVLDADLSKSTKTHGFSKEFPNRFFNMGIAEQNLMGTAAGLAASGKIPFASTFAVFAAGRAFEIIRNSICYPKLNVKVCATHAGITVGEDGASHQAIEDLAIMRALPNMTVLNPADAVSAEALLKEAAMYNGPVYVRLGRAKVPVIYDENNTKFSIGKGIEVKEGNDIAIIATGIMVDVALKAAEELSKQGISARIIDIHTIKPIDREIIIKTAKETKGIITAEEHNIIGGLGSAVAEVLVENYPAPLKRIGINDTFGESGKPDELMKKYGLTAENIVEKAKEILGK